MGETVVCHGDNDDTNGDSNDCHCVSDDTVMVAVITLCHGGNGDTVS